MIRKNHTDQIHNEWDKKNNEINLYIPQFKKMLKVNFEIMKKIEGVNNGDLKLLKNYFKRQVSRACWLSIRNLVPDIYIKNQTLKIPFNLKLRYYIYMLMTPLYSLRLILRPGRLKKYF